jgi:hypothetical protein
LYPTPSKILVILHIGAQGPSCPLEIKDAVIIARQLLQLWQHNNPTHPGHQQKYWPRQSRVRKVQEDNGIDNDNDNNNPPRLCWQVL